MSTAVRPESMGRISTPALSKLWRSKYGIDVDRFFSSGELELKAVLPYKYFRFTSAQSGDPDFYAQLMARLGYEVAEKAEFREAANHVNSADRVLDVGCGTGNFSQLCRGIYRGIDTNPLAVQDAGRLRRNVHLARVQDEGPDSYDLVTVFQVLEHVDDPKSFLQACVKCVRPGGRIVVSTPDMDGFIGHMTNEVLNYPPHHLTWWSEESLSALLEDCGCEPIGIWHEQLRRDHVRGALTALLSPRGEAHLNSSIFFRGVDLASGLLARFVYPKWNEIPFIKGHTVMVQAKKTKVAE
jgi:SAM-dependent methyltransferase